VPGARELGSGVDVLGGEELRVFKRPLWRERVVSRWCANVRCVGGAVGVVADEVAEGSPCGVGPRPGPLPAEGCGLRTRLVRSPTDVAGAQPIAGGGGAGKEWLT